MQELLILAYAEVRVSCVKEETTFFNVACSMVIICYYSRGGEKQVLS